jgi:hypothetical protein
VTIGYQTAKKIHYHTSICTVKSRWCRQVNQESKKGYNILVLKHETRPSWMGRLFENLDRKCDYCDKE